MTLEHVARLLDLLALATAFGATVWFFFVQSPVLLRRVGRERFVPIQMALTLILFRVLVGAVAIVAASTIVHTGLAADFTASLTSAAMITAGVALVGTVVNQVVIVPRALRAGGRTRADIRDKDDEGTVAGFASKGAGDRTQRMHRLVVVFVVVMLGGLIGHAATLVA